MMGISFKILQKLTGAVLLARPDIRLASSAQTPYISSIITCSILNKLKIFHCPCTRHQLNTQLAAIHVKGRGKMLECMAVKNIRVSLGYASSLTRQQIYRDGCLVGCNFPFFACRVSSDLALVLSLKQSGKINAPEGGGGCSTPPLQTKSTWCAFLPIQFHFY